MTPVGFALASLTVLTGLLCGLLVRSRREALRLRERLEKASGDLQNLQHAFSRFAPEEVVEQVIASGLSDRGERREVTALFADLVGFTALCEAAEPSVLVKILNGYFERMSRAISDHRGHVSTFIGDGILAFFGALTPNPWQENDAVHAALAMRCELVAYNRELEQHGLPTLAIGIGLQRGSGVAGLVGSRELKQFAFVGRTVNVAARVQELTRQFPADIIVTGTLRERLDPRFVLRALPPATLKGVTQPVAVFAVDGFVGDAQSATA